MQLPKLLRKKHEKRLTIELRPETVRSKTLFQMYSKTRRIADWSSIKEALLTSEGSYCFVCGTRSTNLHLHEFWSYNDDDQTMSLQGIHHICNLCQKIKRTDFWFFTDYGKEQLKKLDIGREELIKHYCKVNNCSPQTFDNHLSEAITVWKERSKLKWKQNYGDYLP